MEMTEEDTFNALKRTPYNQCFHEIFHELPEYHRRQAIEKAGWKVEDLLREFYKNADIKSRYSGTNPYCQSEESYVAHWIESYIHAENRWNGVYD